MPITAAGARRLKGGGKRDVANLAPGQTRLGRQPVEIDCRGERRLAWKNPRPDAAALGLAREGELAGG